MANQKHLDLLKQGVQIWEKWRNEHPDIRPDLRSANLREARLGGAYLREADLTGACLASADLTKANLWHARLVGANLIQANLNGANLSGANLVKAYLCRAKLRGTSLGVADLRGADLSGVDLSGVHLNEANLSGANLSGANLSRTDLSGANLSRTDLSGANLTGADLRSAILVRTNLTDAILTDCLIYGISAWNLKLGGARQTNLIITYSDEPTITVDNLKVAQFIYLLLNNEEIHDVVNTLTMKAVLILGRFTTERKKVLDALRDALREHNYLPILFDFEKPNSRDVTETVRTLAHLSRFILADLTEPSSIPLELETIVPHLEVPVQPLLLETKKEFSMFVSLRKYQWVLPTYTYKDLPNLLASLEQLLASAEQKADELTIEKAKRLTGQ